MVDSWLTAIEDLLLEAPGNTNPGAGDLWDSTLERLGCTTEEEARARIYWDYHETTDVAELRPFFVIRESDVDWEEFDLQTLAAIGAVEVAYTEQTLDTADTHKAAKEHFVAWTSRLIRSCAERRATAGVPICAIRQLILPQRAPRGQRNPDVPATDYWWQAWQFVIAERSTGYR